MKKVQITDELINRLCHDYFDCNKSMNYIHAKYGITYDKMREILNAHGGVRPTKRVNNIELYKQVYEDYASGLTDVNYLSRKNGTSNSTVYKILHSYGIWTTNNKQRVDREKVWSLYIQGKSIVEIADAVCCSRNLVYRLVREYKANHYGSAMQKSVDIEREMLYNKIEGGDEMALCFCGKLQKNNTVTIPQAIQVALGLKCGDIVEFEIVPTKGDIIVQVKKKGEE